MTFDERVVLHRVVPAVENIPYPPGISLEQVSRTRVLVGFCTIHLEYCRSRLRAPGEEVGECHKIEEIDPQILGWLGRLSARFGWTG